jgi:hypothetical protein
LERVESAGPQDSGWYAGSIEGSLPANLTAIRVGDLLTQGPQWTRMLDLPVGTLVVLQGETVEALLNDRGTILWPPSAESAEKWRQT